MQVDARRHDHDLRVAGAVVAVELRCLVAGVGCQHVGFADDRGLAALPYVGLGRLASSEIGVLHPGHRVHGVHQRDAAAPFQLQTDRTGEPVVGMNQIMIIEPSFQLSGELLGQCGQCFLGDRFRGPSLEVNHSRVLIDLDDVRDIAVRPAG